MRLSNLSIAKKIGIAFAVIIVGAAIMGFAVRQNMVTIDSARITASTRAAIILEALEARGALTRQENSLRGYLITKDTYYSDRVKKHFGTFGKHIQAIRDSKAGTLAVNNQAASEG